jgi:hypothetical protein
MPEATREPGIHQHRAGHEITEQYRVNSPIPTSVKKYKAAQPSITLEAAKWLIDDIGAMTPIS